MEDKSMNLVDHLDELRKRVIISLVAFITFFIVSFIYVQDIYNWLVRDLEFNLTVLGPSDILWVYFMLSGVAAIIASIPVIAFQVWLFVKPALHPHERRLALGYIPALFLLFILGLCFGYFVILPVIMDFLVGLGSDMFETMFTTEKYFRFVLHMTIPFAVLFELPIVVMFLTSLGIINPYVMTRIRKYAYFVLIVISVSISPPDFISDFLVTIPLLVLYELSIGLSKIVYKRRQKRLAKEEKEFAVSE
ncbi:twin-arginine translocase subunit TatC [Bacillus sp. HMF5848]|uniref:twin-arginine translocase subunit TatC n=1 Tax=Bacillus sp. HMF5848 TaxID=2495421 RepID=UPI000F777FAE|nr:twin-arginine translocase subunit TatC [Bacillus sp. HMF5848]RSK27947.1 twin-arginine translocase subunit TatC [Bacillus sp. HMF5848]